jgi:hypothetical protein
MERPELTEVVQDTFGTSSLLILLSILRSDQEFYVSGVLQEQRIQSVMDNISTVMTPSTTDLRIS